MVSDFKCPLGEDCDLTLSYMAGYHDAKIKYADEIARLRNALRRIIQLKPTGIEGYYVRIARTALGEKE